MSMGGGRLLVAALLARCAALDAPVTAAKLQWERQVRSVRVALLTDTEDQLQSAHAMWPVAVAMDDLLGAIGGEARSVITCLPFATGRECRTFGLRRYEKRAGAWALASASGVANVFDAAEALCAETGYGEIALRSAELSIDVAPGEAPGALTLSGFPCEGASLDAGVSTDDLAEALGLDAGAVAFCGKTAGGSIVAEVDGAAAMVAAETPDLAALGAKRVLVTAAASGGAFASRALGGDGDDGLTAAVCALGLFWTARQQRGLDEPLSLTHGRSALSLSLSAPPEPKFGGRKRKHMSRLPSVAVTLAAPE